MTAQERLEKDLLTLSPQDFYFKHIVKSNNWYFSEYLGITSDRIIDQMDLFKEIVSTGLHINFHSVQIVGSAKTGYSLSPNKVLKPFHEETDDSPSSDIDIAIVSETLYNKFWTTLRAVREKQYKTLYFKRLTSSIFRGYINDKDLVHIDGPDEEWSEMIRPINVSLQDKLGFVHPVTYRIYRSWDDLQEYQIIGIAKAKSKLEERKNV